MSDNACFRRVVPGLGFVLWVWGIGVWIGDTIATRDELRSES